MRSLIINILLRLLGRSHYSKLSEKETTSLLKRVATEEGFERLPDFLEQCSDTYRNQFLYTKDERFRGAVLAMTELRGRIVNAKPKSKDLTKDKKSVKIKKPY